MHTSSSALTTTPSTTQKGFTWSDDLLTGDARMDHTHEEFANQLNALLATQAGDQLPLYKAFLDHTVAHFAQEDRWMQATGFTPTNCHSEQHAMVLETMQAVVAHYQKGETEIINRMGEALAEWFEQHAVSMDAGLAQHLQSVGFDSATETLADPQVIRNVTVSGCGSISCS
ncbi:MAG: hemerythrin domain-containing protein [Betaproteobacteria bacterium]